MDFWGSGSETCFVLFEGDLCMLNPGLAALGTSRFMGFGRDLVGDVLLKGRSEAVGVARAVLINPVQAYVLV